MGQDHDLMERILSDGGEKRDRTGTDTLSVFGHQMRFDLADGSPLVSTNKLHAKSIVYDMPCVPAGDAHVKSLIEHGGAIWEAGAGERGVVGRVHGEQWR